MQLRTESESKLDKVKRYKWAVDHRKLRLEFINKNKLHVDASYQRDVMKGKVLEIASNWSWLACGGIVVAKREGKYWVIDGGHRVAAAAERSDIADLPCLVFDSEGADEEAQAFLQLNTNRKPIKIIDRHKARLVAGDKTAGFVQEWCDLLELRIMDKTDVGTIKSIGWCYRRAQDDPDAFVAVLSFAAETSKKHRVAISERLLEGVWYINKYVDGGLENKRLYKRMDSIGAQALLDAANRASAFYTSGGARIWATGMMEEINKGLRHKFVLNSPQTE